MKKSNIHFLDYIFLSLLTLYIFAGVPIVPFFGDESMQIRMSKDYDSLFIDKNLEPFLNTLSYDPRSDVFYRFLEGSLPHFVIGFARHFSSMSADRLPPSPGWLWEETYETNINQGFRPDSELLISSRFSLTVFSALSSFLLFFIAKQIGGTFLAYYSTILYATNPVFLTNARRAMAEGAMLFFGLATILISLRIIKRLARKEKLDFKSFVLLSICSALALASKHLAFTFVVPAYTSLLYIFFTNANSKKLYLRWWSISALLTLLFFLLVSPHLWNNPLLGLAQIVAHRYEYIQSQIVFIQQGEANSILERVFLNAYVPFGEGIVNYWPTAQPIQQELTIYTSSIFSGIQLRSVGWIVFILTLFSMVLPFVALRKKTFTRPIALLVVWYWISFIILLFNPLAMQRYYLPLIPPMCLLSGIFIQTVVLILQRKQR